MSAPSLQAIFVSIGNTRARVAAGGESGLEPSQVFDCTDLIALAAGIRDLAQRHAVTEIVIATVNQRAASDLSRELVSGGGMTIRRVGTDIPIPIHNTLTDDSTVGQDRLLCALGAFTRSKQACIIIDAGTAVTVDFVDGEGVFHGGAIAPGLSMMRDALHEKTAALPKVELPRPFQPAPGKPPFGKTTTEAITVGITSSIIGMTHLLIDRYAEFYAAYPRVLATGGDAALLFEEDELVESIVPDLPLIGMLAAWELADE